MKAVNPKLYEMSMKRTSFPLTLVAATCVVLAGCEQCSKKDESKTAEVAATAADPNAAAGLTAPAPAPTDPNAQAAAPADATAAAPADATAAAPAEAAAPAAEPAKAAEDPTGGNLKITDIKAGNGAVAAEGKKVSVNYTGTLLNGTKFDSNKDRGTPFSFVLGSGMVIAGWDQGLKGMKEGGVRKLVIPPNLAYGNRSVGGVIPPNSTLVFEIELLKVE